MTSPIPTDLVPCPLCGSAAGIGRSDDGYWNVECSMPSCNLTLQPRVRWSRDRVVWAWNTRAATGVEHLQSQLTAARGALEGIADGQAFREQRFAEDDDAEYFLRAQRRVQTIARAALKTMEQGDDN